MINVNNFISKHITQRAESMFLRDIEKNRVVLTQEIEGKSVLVIGGGWNYWVLLIFVLFCLLSQVNWLLWIFRRMV